MSIPELQVGLLGTYSEGYDLSQVYPYGTRMGTQVVVRQEPISIRTPQVLL